MICLGVVYYWEKQHVCIHSVHPTVHTKKILRRGVVQQYTPSFPTYLTRRQLPVPSSHACTAGFPLHYEIFTIGRLIFSEKNFTVRLF